MVRLAYCKKLTALPPSLHDIYALKSINTEHCDNLRDSSQRGRRRARRPSQTIDVATSTAKWGEWKSWEQLQGEGRAGSPPPADTRSPSPTGHRPPGVLGVYMSK